MTLTIEAMTRRDRRHVRGTPRLKTLDAQYYVWDGGWGRTSQLARVGAGPLEPAASCDSRGFKRATCLRVLQSDGAVETAERTRSPVDTGKEG